MCFPSFWFKVLWSSCHNNNIYIISIPRKVGNDWTVYLQKMSFNSELAMSFSRAHTPPQVRQCDQFFPRNVSWNHQCWVPDYFLWHQMPLSTFFCGWQIETLSKYYWNQWECKENSGRKEQHFYTLPSHAHPSCMRHPSWVSLVLGLFLCNAPDYHMPRFSDCLASG